MSVLFPPILESQRASVPSYRPPAARTDFIIPVTLPQSVTPTMVRGGHVQVLIRRQIDMEIWSEPNMANTPEKDVIYLPGTALNTTGTSITVPFNLVKAFIAGNTLTDIVANQTGRTYTVQVRFGDEPLWNLALTSEFAAWKARCVANSLFGEWSNTQRMFCYGVPTTGNIFNVSIINDVIGRLDWQYVPISEDPVAEVRLTYSWSTPDSYGNNLIAKNVDFSNSSGQNSGSFGNIDLEVMRFAKITASLRITTINDSIFEWNGVLESIDDPAKFPIDTSAANRIQSYPIVGEELEDGVLAMNFTGTFRRNTAVSRLEEIYYNIYRVDVITLETILMATLQGITGAAFTEVIRDYSVEMGAEYAYVAVSYGKTTGSIHYILVPLTNLTPATWNPPRYSGYGRQMNFNSNLFITTKFQQLRMQGNVTVSSFQRNTSDQITQTIGSQYPFYSRSADINYRTFGIQGLVSLNFDSTNTFLKFKSQQSPSVVNAKNRVAEEYQLAMWELNKAPGDDYNQRVLELQNLYYSKLKMIYEGINPPPVPAGEPAKLNIDWTTGQLWFVENKDVDQIQIRTPDLFSMEEYSLSRKRVMSRDQPKNQWIDSLDNKDGYIHTTPPKPVVTETERIRGATSVYDSQLTRDVTQVTNSDRTNSLIYAERKFRDAVMSWLSDGKPKLIRSETEGNMIVMLTGISFSPLNKSRQVYSLSATVTEIAKCDLKNLVLYGLVPVDFQPFYIPGIEFDFVPGAVDTNITTAY